MKRFLSLCSIALFLYGCGDSAPVETIVDLGLGPSRQELKALREADWCGNLIVNDTEWEIERYRFRSESNPNKITEWNKILPKSEDEFAIYEELFSRSEVKSSLTPIDPFKSEQVASMFQFAKSQGIEIDIEELKNNKDFVGLRLKGDGLANIDLIPCAGLSVELTKDANVDAKDYILRKQPQASLIHFLPVVIHPTTKVEVADGEGELFCKVGDSIEVLEFSSSEVFQTIHPNISFMDILEEGEDLDPNEIKKNSSISKFSLADKDEFEIREDGLGNYLVIINEVDHRDIRKSLSYMPCDSFYDPIVGKPLFKQFINVLKKNHNRLKKKLK